MKSIVARSVKFFCSTLLLTGILLSACGKNERGDLKLAEPKSAGGRVEDQFGEQFGNAFRADANAGPMNVSDGDTVSVSDTAEPADIR